MLNSLRTHWPEYLMEAAQLGIFMGMLVAAFAYEALKRPVACAKMHHQNDKRCIFCEYQSARKHQAVAADVRKRNIASLALENRSA